MINCTEYSGIHLSSWPTVACDQIEMVPVAFRTPPLEYQFAKDCRTHVLLFGVVVGARLPHATHIPNSTQIKLSNGHCELSICRIRTVDPANKSWTHTWLLSGYWPPLPENDSRNQPPNWLPNRLLNRILFIRCGFRIQTCNPFGLLPEKGKSRIFVVAVTD